MTGPLGGAELTAVGPDPECDVRVVIGPAEGAELALPPELECDALVRVVTAAPPAATVAAHPAACEPLDLVPTELVEGERPRLAAADGPPDGPMPW